MMILRKNFFSFSLIILGIFFCLVVQAQISPLSFFVDPQYDFNKRSQIIATLKKIGDFSYFYVDDNWWENLTTDKRSQALDSINKLSSEFDKVIYPKLTQFFGDIWSPGIDQDLRVTVLVLPLLEEAGGYINYADEYSRTKIPNSNEREMFYLNSFHLQRNLVKSFMAHEFQHLITFNQKFKIKEVGEEVWLNEALAEYAPTYLGYDDEFQGSNLQRRVKDFLANPSDPLGEFKNEKSDYGNVNLFIQYLVDHYGKEILPEILKDEKSGIESINSALKKRGYNTNFSEIFTNWTIANLLQDCSLGEFFCYKNPNLNSNNLKISTTSSLTVGDYSKIKIKDWQPLYYSFDSKNLTKGKMLKIQFSSQDKEAVFKIPYIVFDFQNKASVNSFNLVNNFGEIQIPDFGEKINSLVLIPSKQSKMKDFTENDPESHFDLKVFLEERITIPQYRDGDLLRREGDYKVYLIRNEKRHWIPNPWIFLLYDLKWENIKEVKPEVLESFPRAKLFRPKGDYKVYYLTETGLIRHIPTPEVFLSYNNRWEDVLEVERAEIAAYPESNLIRCFNDYRVYKLENGQKRWIKTAEVFNRLKYDWSKIAPVNLTEFNAYPEGKPIE